MLELRDWRIADPLGELMKLAGADRLGHHWRMGGIPSLLATGVQPTQDAGKPNRAWLAVPTRLHTGQQRALIDAGFATLDEFRDIPALLGSVLVPGLCIVVDPQDTSANDLLTHAQELVGRAQMLRGIVKANATASRMAALLGDHLPDRLVPAWEKISEVRWGEGDGCLATHAGSFTGEKWDWLPGGLRRRVPDGIRIRRQGDVVTVAAAAEASSFYIEDEVRDEGSSLIGLAASCFVIRPRGGVADRLGRADDVGGHLRLFHVEHTAGHGSHVWVFNPWGGGMVEHPQLTSMWTTLVSEPTPAAQSRLWYAAQQFHWAAVTGIQPIDEQ